MISVLTLTYQRPNLLEEAIHSFLIQNQEDCEMVVINDSEKSKLTFSLIF
jgi:glycosyltransferase involved in cell wall biosynthesis